jgi:pimeloyl-ACP methyl ester carboxylesterase
MAAGEGRNRAPVRVFFCVRSSEAAALHRTAPSRPSPTRRAVLEQEHDRRCSTASKRERGAALRARWSLDAERILRPVRIVWGRKDKLLPWPPRALRTSAARRCRTPTGSSWTASALADSSNVPLETAELIAGFTAG